MVIEPVAHAARLAEALSWHDDRIVVSARPGTDPVIDAGQEIDGLIKTMNVAADLGLLEKIPDVLRSGLTASGGRLPLRQGNTHGCRSP